MNQPGQPPLQAMQFEFKGTAFQYFGIWIVNLLLIIITLGIYSAWAKVRTKRYFYGNTLLDGSPFDYLANPISILKGWGIAVVVLLAYNLLTNVFPVTSLLLVPLMLIALPWVIVRAMRFRARNSAWRNIRFGFKKAYAEAFKVFIGVQLLMVLSLGLLLPYYYYVISRFMVTNSGYGTTQFSFHARPKDFYKIFLKPLLAMLLVLAVILAISYPKLKEYYHQYEAAVAAAQMLQEDELDADSVDQQDTSAIMQEESVVATYDLTGVDETLILDADSSYEEQRAMMLEQAMQDLANANASLANAEDMDAQQLDVPVADHEHLSGVEDEYINPDVSDLKDADGASVDAEFPGQEQVTDQADNNTTGSEDETSDAIKHAIMGMGMLFMLAFFLFYLVFIAYIQSRIWNLVYNSTQLAGHYFISTVRARDILWLYASNLIAIALSFGLMIPWARVRLARYRTRKLQFIAVSNLDHFMQAQQEKISALGEELGDVFDLDVGI